MLRFEFEEPRRSTCQCCGEATTSLTRFVYKDDAAFAVYYAQFSDGHPERRLSGIIGLGEWGDDEAGPEARLAFPFQIWMDDDNFQVGLVDAADSSWSHVTFLGRILDRSEALIRPWIEEVFHITDHMVMEDKEIAIYFG